MNSLETVFYTKESDLIFWLLPTILAVICYLFYKYSRKQWAKETALGMCALQAIFAYVVITDIIIAALHLGTATRIVSYVILGGIVNYFLRRKSR